MDTGTSDAAVTGPRSWEGDTSQLSGLRFAAGVVILTTLSWLPVPTTIVLGPRAGWTFGLALGLVVAAATRSAPPSAVIGALLAASALSVTGLVNSTSLYMPVAVTGIALVGGWTWRQYRARVRPELPPRPVLVAAAAYLVWALASSLFSIDRRLSAGYAVGMLLVIAVAFVLVPTALDVEVERRRVLGVVAWMALIASATSVATWFTGPVTLIDRPVGDYLATRIVLLGHTLPVVVPHVSGVFLTPAPETVVLVAGLVAILSFRAYMTGRMRAMAAVAAAVVLVALLDTQAREGMLMGAVGAAGLAFLLWRGRHEVDAWSLGVAIVLAAVLALTLANVIGTALTAEEVALRHNAVGADQLVSVRGGTGLSGRLPLWSASLDAIRSRPIVGSGPGTDALAIGPRLHGIYEVYRGLTSHSTWFRTAVEMGVPGLLALLALVTTCAVAAARRLRARVDVTIAAMAAAAAGLTAGQFFETFLMGGVAFQSLYWAVSLGLVAVSGRRAGNARPDGLNVGPRREEQLAGCDGRVPQNPGQIDGQHHRVGER